MAKPRNDWPYVCGVYDDREYIRHAIFDPEMRDAMIRQVTKEIEDAQRNHNDSPEEPS
jgi:hypothetical protein